jgi:hypothetical protein
LSAPQPHIGVLRERSLHAAVKSWYARPEDHLETQIDGYVIDIAREDDLLVEIQTRSFAPLKSKLRSLTQTRRVRLVHPIAVEKWILRVDADGARLGRRKSPKRGRVEDVFGELVSIPDLLTCERFALEVLLIQEEEVRCYDGNGTWRHPEWRRADRRLLEVVERCNLATPAHLLRLLPGAGDLPRPFTNRELAAAAGVRLALAGKMTYCLRAMEALTVVGRGKHNAQLFAEV